MATEFNVVSLTRPAGADLSTKQYYLVEQGATGTVTVCNAAGEGVLGVLQNDPVSGQMATVAYQGISKVIAGDTIVAGNELTTDASGQAIPATTGQKVFGQAMSGAAVGQVVSVLIQHVSSGSILTGYVDVTVSTAEVKLLNAAPKTLVAAPGAGQALIFLGAELFLDYNSTAYDGIASGEDLSIKYTDASGAEVAQIEATGFLSATADALRYVHPTTTTAITPVANAPLVLNMLVGDIATGNSPLKVRVFYRVIPSTL